MPKKKETKAASPKAEAKPSPKEEEKQVKQETKMETAKPAAQAAEPQKKEMPAANNSSSKNLMIFILLILAIALVYYFFTQSTSNFSPGTTVDQQTFKTIFASASKVYIVMDVRGVKDVTESDNILQCGVDFAASNGMAGKTVIPMSLNDSGCVEPDGNHQVKDCISQLNSGLTIYVQSGPTGVNYYSNGMIVSPGTNYSVGGCAITQG